MDKFNIKIALEDKGDCSRQKVHCEDCNVGIKLIQRHPDELCNHKEVYEAAKFLDDFMEELNR